MVLLLLLRESSRASGGKWARTQHCVSSRLPLSDDDISQRTHGSPGFPNQSDSDHDPRSLPSSLVFQDGGQQAAGGGCAALGDVYLVLLAKPSPRWWSIHVPQRAPDDCLLTMNSGSSPMRCTFPRIPNLHINVRKSTKPLRAVLIRQRGHVRRRRQMWQMWPRWRVRLKPDFTAGTAVEPYFPVALRIWRQVFFRIRSFAATIVPEFPASVQGITRRSCHGYAAFSPTA